MKGSTEACNKLSLRTTVSTRSSAFGPGWRVYSLLNWKRESVAMVTVSRRGTECKQGAEPDHRTYFIRRQRKKDATCKRQTKLQFIVSGVYSTRRYETQRNRHHISDGRDFRFPPRRISELLSSGLPLSEWRWIHNDVSRQTVGSILRVRGFLNPEDGTDGFSRNVGKNLPLFAA